MSTEIQPYSSFHAFNVPPEQVTPLKLSGGRTIPYVYQLGVNSTAPYVKLIGSSVGQKLFSWTEKIIVPPGEMVTVANASYHPGDIWINSGWDPSVLPARVTVPVPIVGVPEAAPVSIRGLFGLDTRRARRAFLAGLLPTSANPETLIVTSVARERSHGINDNFSDSPPGFAAYGSSITVNPFTDPGLLPLGESAGPNDGVHALLDYTTFTWSNLTLSASGSLHYVLEYV